MRRGIAVLGVVLLAMLVASPGAEAKFKPKTVAASPSSSSATANGNGDSYASTISANGRYVLFYSDATDLLAGESDANAVVDLFWRDLRTGTTRLISHAAGSETTAVTTGTGSSSGQVGDDGAVVWQTTATDVVSGFTDNNTTNTDVYRWTPDTGTNMLLSHQFGSTTSGGAGSNGGFTLSPDGSVVITYTKADLISGGVDNNGGGTDVFWIRTDTSPSTAKLVSHATSSTVSTSDCCSSFGMMGGRKIAYVSASTDLTGVATGGDGHIYVYDVDLATTTLLTTASNSASAADDDSQFPSISPDGRYVTFASYASDLIPSFTDNNGVYADAYLFDLKTGKRHLVSHQPGLPATGSDLLGLYEVLPASDGTVYFRADGDDLVPNFDDGNGPATPDFFFFDSKTEKVSLVNHVFDDKTASINSNAYPIVNVKPATETRVTFITDATDVVKDSDVSSAFGDVYQWSASKGKVKLISHVPGDNLTGAGDCNTTGAASASGRSVTLATDKSLVDGFATGGKFATFVYLGSKP